MVGEREAPQRKGLPRKLPPDPSSTIDQLWKVAGFPASAQGCHWDVPQWKGQERGTYHGVEKGPGSARVLPVGIGLRIPPRRVGASLITPTVQHVAGGFHGPEAQALAHWGGRSRSTCYNLLSELLPEDYLLGRAIRNDSTGQKRSNTGSLEPSQGPSGLSVAGAPLRLPPLHAPSQHPCSAGSRGASCSCCLRRGISPTGQASLSSSVRPKWAHRLAPRGSFLCAFVSQTEGPKCLGLIVQGNAELRH